MALTMMFAVVTVAVAFGVLFRVEQVVAWGADGHRVTCLIAEVSWTARCCRLSGWMFVIS